MKVVITGTSHGIGRAIAEVFTMLGHEVHGIDKDPAPFENANYTHHVYEFTGAEYRIESYLMPDIRDVEILVNNAGVQGTNKDIQVNLISLINCTKKYAFQPSIKSVVNISSASAHHGAEFGEYTASKGGVLSYTRWTAKQLYQYGATCNSISPGGVLTDLNACVIDNEDAWNEIMDLTPLKKWATSEEIAEWVYFLAVTNKSMTGQDILIDNGEFLSHKFVWVD